MLDRLKRAIPRPVKVWIKRMVGRAPLREEGGRLALVDAGAFRLAVRVGTVDEEVLRHSFDRDVFFAGLPEYQPSPGDTILDVGAHIGTFAMLAATKVPLGRVLAVEASRETAGFLEVNVRMNGLANVSVHRLALWDAAGTARLHYDAENWGHTMVTSFSYGSETVPTETLGGFLDAQGISRVHLGKFNCEGAEFRILLGSPLTVLSRFDVMLVLYHCDLAGTPLDGLVAHLRAAGFRTVTRHVTGDGDRGWLVALSPRMDGSAPAAR